MHSHYESQRSDCFASNCASSRIKSYLWPATKTPAVDKLCPKRRVILAEINGGTPLRNTRDLKELHRGKKHDGV